MSVARRLYTLAGWLIRPLLRRYLKKRAKKAPAYLEHWDERFGDGYAPRATGAIWIHAVSVGETRAALPLVHALRARYPDAPLLITQMTPTGRATALQLYPDAEVRYLPYDFPRAVAGFFAAYRPRFGVLMETELWPNLIHAAHKAGVPLLLGNARLSDKSYRGYRRVAPLIRPALASLAGVAAQTEADAARLVLLGTRNIKVCGNTKYDFAPPAAQLALGRTFRTWLGDKPVLVAASTRDGEEALILAAWRKARPKARLVIVPRHPERFDSVATLAEQQGFTVARRSATSGPLADDVDVWIGDSMGELFGYYAAADLAFVGGSLLPLGGQNLIEPASVGVPVLFGPSMFNFPQASELALAAGAALQVADADALVAEAVALLSDVERRAAMGAAAQRFTAAHRGASERIVDYFAERLADQAAL
ncbi:lipid IV(A) 3-deoxy-D-manno-octulosonic acid transferase [Crenobacter sp. SG2305]|nr:lipid IV(A) 3-deoxy-D-manno-octulosonic acid transferase [Crenobacter sp. SG2305]MDN0083715.1 lipid IV(A) 3-deoxy-D-manno-octulosonic acid transferase [Crenobacter sp. SG2305]